MLPKLKFYIDDLLSRGSNSLILWLGFLSVLAVTVATALVWALDLGPQDSFGGLFWDLMMRAITPWEIEASMGSFPYLLVLLGITLFGIFVLSILISLLSAIINARVQNVTRGSLPFPFEHHIIILGWSPRLVAIISELIIANESNKLLRVLIMSEKSADELGVLVETSFTSMKTTKLYFRSRDLCNESSYVNANLQRARQILVLGDESEEIEGSRLKIYLSLCRYLSSGEINENNWPEIIVNVDSQEEADIIDMTSDGKAVTVNVSDIPARLIIETVIQPNLPNIYEEVLSFEGNEIYIADSMVNIGLGKRSFAKASGAMSNCIPIGYWTEDDEVIIAPASEAIVGANDSLIVISEDDSTIEVESWDNLDSELINKDILLDHLHPGKMEAQRVLLIGVSTNHQFIFDKLIQFGSGLKSLTVCLPNNEYGILMKEQLAKQETNKAKFILAKTDSPIDLAELEPQKYDSIIVSHTALHQTGGTDVQTIKSIQILRSLLGDKLPSVHLIAEMLEGKNRDILAYELNSDFVVSEKIGSKVFAQYIENPKLRRIIDLIVCSKSHQIKIYTLKVGTAPIKSRFKDIGRSLMTKQKILIGWAYNFGNKRISKVNPKADTILPEGYEQLSLIVVERQ